MTLRCGLDTEVVWAINALTVILHDDTVAPPSLNHLPGEHTFRKKLGFEKCLENKTEFRPAERADRTLVGVARCVVAGRVQGTVDFECLKFPPIPDEISNVSTTVG